MKLKMLALALAAMTLVGCGAADRMAASLTGGASETCVDGVVYLQFTSGATVKYNRDSTVAQCR